MAVALLLAFAFLAAHVATPPATPIGVDAVNFVLGVQNYDVAEHRPHPPGYPVFIGLAKTSALVFNRFKPALDIEPIPTMTRAVAMLSSVFGAIAVFALRRLFRELRAGDCDAVAAAALVVACPLFWFNGYLATSDVTGLTAAVIAQGLIVSALWRNWRAEPGAGRQLIVAAFVTGVTLGVRSQVAWLTLPLLAFAIFELGRRLRVRAATLVVAALAAGALLWLGPMMLAGDGLMALLRAFGAQARDDVTSGHMLAAGNGDTRLFVDAMVRTLAYPWANKYLAAVVLGVALVGAVSLVRKDRIAAGLLTLGFAPYAIFHLLFQDTSFVRYALPLVPPIAFLMIRGLYFVLPPLRPVVVTALVCVCLTLAIPPALSLAREGSPSLRAFGDTRQRQPATGPRPVLAMHHAVSRVLRLERLPAETLASPPKHEWLALVEYWLNGGESPVWFLAEPERTDLESVDPHARRLLSRYRLAVDRRFFLSGVRPAGVDWYEIDRPGWFLAGGWGLTPESAGVAVADGRGPSRGPISAYVRRRDEDAVMMVGGRHLKGATPARFELAVDGRLIDTWTVAPSQSFLRRVPIPRELLHRSRASDNPRYAHVQVHSNSVGAGSALTAIEQFDVQSAERVVFGLGDGWFEQEYDPNVLQLRRWMGPRAVLAIEPGKNDVVLRAAGDAPVLWLGGAATVIVRAGSDVLGRFVVAGPFDLTLRVPAEVLQRAAGQVTIESDRAFTPSTTLGTPDHRALALRLSRVQVDADAKGDGRLGG